MPAICKICNNHEIKDFYQVKEMMYGLNETFTYFLCSHCDCLQIETPPADMSKYYDSSTYYSFNTGNSLKTKIINALEVLRDKGELFNESFIGKFLSKFYSAKEEIKAISYLATINKKSKILDAGTGTGRYLIRLKALEFTNLIGIDPFINKEVITTEGINIYKKTLEEYDEKDFDLITLHHTFEHLAHPKETLLTISKKLVKGGYCIIRIPIIPNDAWDMYRENWFQIDAPRHSFIHSPTSMKIMCDTIGLTIENIIYDSMPYQYYSSELYKRGIPLKDQPPMSKQLRKEYQIKTDIANKNNRGDQAVFILRKK